MFFDLISMSAVFFACLAMPVADLFLPCTWSTTCAEMMAPSSMMLSCMAKFFASANFACLQNLCM